MVLKQIYENQYGNGLVNFHQGPAFQSGQGIFSALGGIFRKIIPAVKGLFRGAKSGVTKAIKSEVGQKIKSDLKDLAIDTGSSLAADLIRNKDPRETLSNSVEEAKSRVANALEQSVKDRRLRRLKRSSDNDGEDEADASEEERSQPKKKKKRKKGDKLKINYSLFDE